MKQNLYRMITGILTVAWMCVIFAFSSQPSTESGKVSGGFCSYLVENVNDLFHLHMSGEQMLSFAEEIEYPVRKAAHMSEYAVLGLLSFAFCHGFAKREKQCYVTATIMAFLYACTDEFHQYFVPGRSAEFKDVCIDTAGALAGLMILYFILKVVRKYCQKSKVTLQ